MRQLYVSPQKKQTKKRDIFFCMEYRLLVTKEPLFWMFRGQKIRSFLSQKVDGNMMFTDYWKVLVLNFSVMGNKVFFEKKKVNEKMIFIGYWKVLVLNFSVMGNAVFFNKKVDVKIIFTLSFWTFHDILRSGKYGFSCSDMSMTQYF